MLILSGTRDARVVADQDGSEEGQRVPTTQLPSLPHLLSGDPLARKVRWHLQDQWIPAVHLAVMRQLEAFSPDVVHTHEPQGLTAAPFSAIAPSSPSARSHGARPQPFLRPSDDDEGTSALLEVVPRMSPSASVRIPLVQRQLRRLICPSDYYRDLHIGLGIVSPERAITIRQGAKPGRARVRTETASPTIGMLGALAPHKGLHTLLEAFESAPASWRLRCRRKWSRSGDVVAAATVDPRIRYDGTWTDQARNRSSINRRPRNPKRMGRKRTAGRRRGRGPWNSHGGQRPGRPPGDGRSGGLHRRGPQQPSRGDRRPVGLAGACRGQ